MFMKEKYFVKIVLPRNINSQCCDRKNNKFAFWAEASLWSTLVSCQLCENDLELEKLSIISQQEPASLTVNLQLFLSVKLLQYRHHQTVKHPRPAVSCDKGLIRSCPDIRHHSASRTFLLWKIFLISPVWTSLSLLALGSQSEYETSGATLSLSWLLTLVKGRYGTVILNINGLWW